MPWCRPPSWRPRRWPRPRRLAAKPRAALLAARRLLKADPAPIAKTIAEEVADYRELMRSPEAKEAFTAFLEKRPPDFAKARRGK